MSTLLLLLVPPTIVLILIIVAAIWLTNVLADQFVGQKHRLLEEIMTTGKMPAVWLGHDRPTSRKSLRKLDKLIKYAQTTPLVDDEETRQILLARLEEARIHWKAQQEDI